MNQTVKIALTITTLVAVAVLSYLMFFKKDSKLYVLKDKGMGDFDFTPGIPPVSSPPISPPSTSTSSGSNFFGNTPSNPFSSKEEVMKFQKWVLSFKKDTSILGSAGADGVWGRNTASAFKKYGEEYMATKNPLQTVISELKKRNLTYSKPNDGSVRVEFNNGLNIARFYPSMGIRFYANNSSTPISSGVYSNGGKTIKIQSGRNKNKVFNNSNVWLNMKAAVKGASSSSNSSSSTVTPSTIDPTKATGKQVAPKGSYVNARSSAMVNNGWINNIVGKVYSPNVVGKVVNFTMGSESKPKVWYRVELQTPVGQHPVGFNVWVRSDALKFVS